MEISYNGKMYNIPRLNSLENDQQLISRSWWIMHNLENMDNDYEQTLLMSKYWHNVFYKNCKYSDEIMSCILDFKYC